MSPADEVIGLKSIDKHTRQCSIVGRILRLWVKKDKTKKGGLEMFLIDGEENNPPYEKAKLNNRWKLTFLFSTKAYEFKGSMIISPNGFDFIPIRDAYSYDKKLILDVMGEVRRPGKMEYVESADGRNYDIVLVDSDGTEIECTLWEGHAELVKQAVDNKKRVEFTKAKIIHVDVDEFWYYELCADIACFKRVGLGKVVGDTCTKCSAPIGSILTRFRIRILVVDHFGQTYFTLVESSVPYFVNKSATQLKKETDERNCISIDFEGEVVSTDKSTTEGSYSEIIEESSSTSITPLKRVFYSIVEDVQQSTVKASKS
ncbi:hypothetical protein OROHE_018399 [Orobanche hederae]